MPYNECLLRVPCLSCCGCYSRSALGVEYLPLSKGSIFLSARTWISKGWQQTVIFSGCYVISTLEIGRIPECSLNLISIWSGDQFKKSLSTQSRSLEGFCQVWAWDFREALRKSSLTRQNSWVWFPLTFSQQVQILLLWVWGVELVGVFDDECVYFVLILKRNGELDCGQL